jgi:hypothetical protein
MPVTKTTKDGKTAYKWGKSGKAYAEKGKAEKQGRAIEASKKKRVRYGK